jgi:hypothetical protein
MGVNAVRELIATDDRMPDGVAPAYIMRRGRSDETTDKRE